MYTKSHDLLKNGPFPESSPFFDKLFLLARVARATNGVYTFLIEDGVTPTVRMDNKIDLPVPLVTEMAGNEQYALFSANVMLHITGHGFPVLRRDGGTRFYPLCYTCPAGRCEQTPQQTAISEVNEEILLILRHTSTGELRTLGIGSPDKVATGLLHKKSELGRNLPRALALPLSWEKGQDSYSLVAHSQSSQEIIEEGSATIIYDERTNAYEICFQMDISLPEGWVIDSVADGEKYGREARIVASLADLNPEECVPALRLFVDRHSV
ncbi:MAG TPA: hypothetical protein DEB25_04955 [Desulfobulbaceae bacterium]|nr:hypothetical protein [Desulfobulbaceae bacterium]